MKFTDLTLISTAIFTALMAGFFFSYSVSVSLGLGKLGNKEFLNAMRNINREVQNPLFFICFFGSLIMLCFSTFYYKSNTFFSFLLCAFLIYTIGVFLVTILVNVPLNNKLDNFDLANATEITITQMRNTFENR
ncbi:anthrone oxygenase family protein [Pedobacter frigoris]|uniref:anthrone oxygenase family protein n=1 Tax=Pedobacter frigoris TaxID=2571272 RepID=UPI00198215E1|nr:anthrone oxygenase family protein [Pedobacter frigoris]